MIETLAKKGSGFGACDLDFWNCNEEVVISPHDHQKQNLGYEVDSFPVVKNPNNLFHGV